MLKQKFSGSVQEVILPDFPDDEDNTVTTTVTKSRRVSFGPNFVKEFIVDSAISAQCMSEYEELFPSSDSSSAHSTHSAVGHSSFVLQENLKFHRPPPPEPEPSESHPKPPKFASTICFSADSPTADMEFTEGCITLAKSILDKKNKEMTLFIQAKAKGPKEEEKGEEKRFVGEKTKVFGRYDDDMSMTRCGKYFVGGEEEEEEGSKENRMPLDAIMRHLDKDDSISDLFNPERPFGQFLGADTSELSDESERLDLNESMEISGDLQFAKPAVDVAQGEDRPSQTSAMELTGKINFNGQHRPSQTSAMELTEKINFNGQHRPNQTSAMELTQNLDSNELQVLRIPASVAQGEERLNQMSAMEQKLPVGETQGEDRLSQASAMELTQKLDSNELQVLKTPASVAQSDDRPNQMSAMDLTEKIDSKGEVRPNQISAVELKLPVNVAQCDDKVKQISAMELTQKFDSNVEDQSNQSSEIKLAQKLDSKELQVLKTPVNVAHSEDRPSRTSAVELTQKLDSNELQVLKTPDNAPQFEDNPNQMSAMELTEDIDPNSQDRPNLISAMDLTEKMDSNELLLPNIPENAQQPEDGPNQVSAMELTQKLDSSHFAVSPFETPEPESSAKKAAPAEAPKTGALDASENPLSFAVDVSVEESVTEGLMDSGLPRNPFASAGKTSRAAESEDDGPREPSLGDLKVMKSLEEQAQEKGCVWSLKGVKHPQRKAQGLLSFRCRLLESTTTLEFTLKMSDEDSLDSCSIVTGSSVFLDEEEQCRLPEYGLAVGLGFEELRKYLSSSQTVGTVRHVPYYMDQVNSFLSKMNAYLVQIHSVLTSYPGSRLRDCRLSFRLFSFPIFFSCVVSIDLSNVFRLSKGSLTFEHDFGCLDEKKVGEIFEECLKGENSVCEFVVQSTRYLVELEKQSGYVSKRKHIRLLPEELKS